MSDTQEKEIQKTFRTHRDQFSKEIKDGIPLLSNIRNIPEVQVTFLSLRQRLLEESHVLLEHFTRLKKNYRERKGEEWESATKTGQFRYSPTEKTTLVDGKVAQYKQALEEIENQINFYTESIRTVDSVLFGIKDRIAAQKLLDGD